MPINLRTLSAILVLAGIVSVPAFASSDSPTEILLSSAQKWVDKDRADLAKNLLHKALLIEPNSPKALLMLGKIALRDGKPAVAQDYLKTLQQTAPDSTMALELYKTIHQINTGTSSQSAKVEPVANYSAVTKKISHLTSASDRGHNKSTPRLDNKAQAASSSTEVKASLPADPDLLARTDALDALDDGKVDIAESALTDILKRRPSDPEVLGGLGFVSLKRGHPADAEQWFIKAVAASKGENSKWVSLVSTAGFWKKLVTANSFFEENKLTESKSIVQQLLTSKPEDPDALALLANIKMAENDPVEAERLYRKALNSEGYNISATRGLVDLLAKSHRSSDALKFLQQIHEKNAEELNKNPAIMADLMRQEANLYMTEGRSSQAMQTLENALVLAPQNAWLRYSLAKLYISLDLTPLAKVDLQEGISASPHDADMLYISALVLFSIDDYAAGLQNMAQISEKELTPKMHEAQDRALMQYYFQQAEQQLAKGNRKEAIRIMSIAQTQGQGNYPATEQVAEGWFKLGQQQQGISAMSKLPRPVPLEAKIYLASLLNRAKMDKELTEYLPSLHIPDGVDEATIQFRATLRDIEFDMASRQADSLIKAGEKEQAQQLAEATLSANHLSLSDYFKFHHRYYSSAKLPAGAISQLIEQKEQKPDDLNIRWELAYAYYQDKQNSKAQKEVEALLALTKADDVDMRLRIADLQQSINDKSGAWRTIDDLISRDPNSADVLLHAGNIAKSEGQYNQAMKFYQRIKPQANTVEATASSNVAEQSARQSLLLDLLPVKPLSVEANTAKVIAPPLVDSPGSEAIFQRAVAADNANNQSVTNFAGSAAEQAMDSIRATRTAKIEVGLDVQSKPAGSGTTTYKATEIPVLVRFPIGYEAHGFVQVDQVNIDAGALPASFSDAALFGKILTAAAVPPQPLTPATSGTSVAAGYEQGSVKADIGKVGIGFPVSNVVGGIRQSGMLGSLSYSLNLSRRPYTGSQLSYAGAKDPASGVTWGGVTNTGLSLYLSSSLSSAMTGDFNVAAIGTYGLLRGTNVLNNDKASLTGIVSKDIYTANDMLVNLGVSLSYLSFSKNLSYFTFGQGGYYSPQSSLTFAIPLELDGRINQLNYQLKTSISYSNTRTDASPFYPTDPALQAAAASVTRMPTGYTQPVYAAGTGGGFGYSVLAASEYRATPHFTVGGRLSIDRSAYYAPNSALFYLRYLFNAETGAVKLRPEPVMPYSQY